MDKVLRIYLWLRSPRHFLVLLCTFVGTSLALHFTNGYDGDWGATNLILSIEASIAGAVLMMVAEESAAMQRANAKAQADMLAVVLTMTEAQEKTLKGVLLIAEAQRDMLLDHRALLEALKAGDERILKTLTEGDPS
jgi:uncharacterized membrane protein